jgi:hypothetical protein
MDDPTSYSFSLTVAEGKRLIAKGVVAMPAVQKALRDGLVVVTKGSTNAYLVEELTGEPMQKGAYVLGRTVPAQADTAAAFEGSLPILVLEQGRRVGWSLEEAMGRVRCGDVVVKGANALNYEAGVAGLLVGHPQGGTIATIIGPAYGTGLHMVIPVGLEKEIAADIRELAALINREPEVSRSGMPSLWPIEGEIVTELEAIELLTGCEAHQISAGGLCGAEGASWFAAWGTEEEIAACKELVQGILGEPAFGT